MFNRIEVLRPVLLAGLKRKIPLTPGAITALWSDFMPQVKFIPQRENSLLYSVQLYDRGTTTENFNPLQPVTKWAAVPVNEKAELPSGLEYKSLEGGLYAVFIHKGVPATFPATMDFIFRNWLPSSGYEWEAREQFEVMGEKYRHNDPLSEEEVWIPLRKK